MVDEFEAQLLQFQKEYENLLKSQSEAEEINKKIIHEVTIILGDANTNLNKIVRDGQELDQRLELMEKELTSEPETPPPISIGGAPPPPPCPPPISAPKALKFTKSTASPSPATKVLLYFSKSQVI